MPQDGPSESTRDRLLAAGADLFARRGFAATSVGEIEEAVGLQPRRGSLYKHFESKDALLTAVVARHLADIATASAQLEAADMSAVAHLPDDELAAIARVAGQWFLDELDRQRDLTRILEHDSDRLSDVAERVRHEIVDRGYRAAASLVAVLDADDPEGLAVVLLGALAAARRTAWTFGAPPLAIDDDRLLDAWALTCVALRDHLAP